jgi:hypothetical protein
MRIKQFLGGLMPTTKRNYRRTYEELEQVASKFWPSELSELEAQISVIPLLLKTQDEFIALLSVPSKSLEKLFEIIESSTLKPNLFVKHLVILADFGGEMLQRVSREAGTLFPNNRISYLWQGEQRVYDFKAFPTQKLVTTPFVLMAREYLKTILLVSYKKMLLLFFFLVVLIATLTKWIIYR